MRVAKEYTESRVTKPQLHEAGADRGWDAAWWSCVDDSVPQSITQRSVSRAQSKNQEQCVMQCRLMLMLRPGQHDGHSAQPWTLPNLSALPLHKRLLCL